MRLLLDSHVVLWWLMEPQRLSRPVTDAISRGTSEVLVSAASIWELSIKQSNGKLTLPGDLHDQAVSEGFTVLHVTGRHAAAVRALPTHHKDPFDRMLVVQAQLEGLTLVTADRAMSAYDVPILPATP